jgi:ADP-ribosyl-[dinitrogen reductase] hydrolase
VSDRRDRAMGAVLGLALGDALGAPFEFRRRSEIPDPLPAFELPWMGMAPGTWTDDTALARNLWRSLIARQGRLDLDDVLARHQEWLAGGPPDVGNQTATALREHARGTPEAARAVFERRGPEVSAGNGSVMYCAPLGVVRAMDPGRLRTEAPALSALTHWDGRCRTACLAVTLATAGLVRGEDAQGVVTSTLEAVADLEGGEELEFLAGEAGRSRPVDGPDMGFTLFCAGLALRTAVEAPSFEAGLRTVVGLGGDTDTNGAVAGALLGAREGLGALPAEWLPRLADRQALEHEADALAEIGVTIVPGAETQTAHDPWSDDE